MRKKQRATFVYLFKWLEGGEVSILALIANEISSKSYPLHDLFVYIF